MTIPTPPAPPTLDRAGIVARLPHAGRMCLLDRLVDWTPEGIRCTATSHHDPEHPLRTPTGLLAPCAIEYAAQAMALHGALCAGADAAPAHGVLASVRGVRFAGPRLDAVAGTLQVRAERLAADARQLQYRFVIGGADGSVFAEGRATIVLEAAGRHAGGPSGLASHDLPAPAPADAPGRTQEDAP